MSIILHVWVSAAALLGVFVGTQSTSLRFYHGSLYNYTTTPVEEPLRLLRFFNRTRVSMFYMFGFNETADSEDATVMLSAYLRTGNTNVILVDWSKEARAEWYGAVLSYMLKAVPNTRIVGRELGRALVMYIQNGICENRIHLAGHSLGAHVAGYAGEFVKENGLELARITGLDPAGPLFDLMLYKGLTASRAKFVDVLHTNPGQYGISTSIGTVDFWANCENSLQPGCPNNTNVDNLDSFCSHWRSYLIYSEAILSPTSIPAVKSDSCDNWQHLKNLSQVIYLGDLVDTSAYGNYYFSTRSEKPFSKGRAGLRPN